MFKSVSKIISLFVVLIIVGSGEIKAADNTSRSIYSNSDRRLLFTAGDFQSGIGINTFEELASGELVHTSVLEIPPLRGAYELQVSPSGKYLVLFERGASNKILVFRIDYAHRKLEPWKEFAGQFFFSALAFHPAERFVYTTANATSYGSVRAYSLDLEGPSTEMKLIQEERLLGFNNLVVVNEGRKLVLSGLHYSWTFDIDPSSGQLTKVNEHPIEHVWYAGPLRYSPSRSLIFVKDRSDRENVGVFTFDSLKNKLAFIQDIQIPNTPLAYLRSISIDPDGTKIYVLKRTSKGSSCFGSRLEVFLQNSGSSKWLPASTTDLPIGCHLAQSIEFAKK